MSSIAPAPSAAEVPSAHAATMAEAFQATAAAYPEMVALRTHDGALEITFAEYAERVAALAAGLAAQGIEKGDTVALLLGNRPEFHLLDTAALSLGATPFSVYGTSSPEQITYLLSNAESKLIVTEPSYLERLAAADVDPQVVCLDDAPAGVMTLAELESSGAPDFPFEEHWRAVRPEDVLTLIYTSGTTGPPKGVELTHANMLAQCRGVAEVLPMRPGARITSYLPSAHIADRWSSHYNCLAYGLQITDVPDPRLIAQVLPTVRPTVWGAVPRIAEKLKAALEAGLSDQPQVKGALAAATESVRFAQAGEEVPAEIAERAAAAQPVMAALREKLGLDQVEWFIIGAAPLSRSVQEFLLALGLPVTEIYGMSEGSCCVTVTHPDDARLGSVGQAIPGVELKLDEDGEVLAKGPTIMRGYRGQPEKTAEAMTDDGWLRTGDIGTLDEHGFLCLVDRKKELIINAGGKNMSPANIEQELKSADPLLGQAVAIGDNRPYNVALLVLDPDIAAATARELGLADASLAALAEDPRVIERVAAAVEQANARLSRVEQIKKYALLADEWAPGGDELTPTMKLKRKPIDAKYAEAIEALYA